MKDVNIYIYTEYTGNLKRGTGKYHVILETEIQDTAGKTIPMTNLDCRPPIPIMGFEENITQNRLELLALKEALKHMAKPSHIIIHIASDYVVNAFFQGWTDKWTKNGFKTGKKEIKHIDLWKSVLELIEPHDYEILKAPTTSYTRTQAQALKNYKGSEEA